MKLKNLFSFCLLRKFTIVCLMILGLNAIFCSCIYAKSIENFERYVPSGWTIIKSAKGDLNGDRMEDVVLVLEKKDVGNIRKNHLPPPDRINLNPRRLLILFKTPDGYKVILKNDAFIPSENSAENPLLEDPFVNIEINRGRLIVKFQESLSSGSWSQTNQTFIFRYDSQGRRFRLIGQDISEFTRNSGEAEEKSINYLTGKQKITTGLNRFKKSNSTIQWKSLKNCKKYYLDQLKAFSELANQSL